MTPDSSATVLPQTDLPRDLRWAKRPFESLLDDIEHDRTFSYVRYGDGEIKWILGEVFSNSSGHQTIPEGVDALRHTLAVSPQRRTDRFHYATGNISWKRNGLYDERNYAFLRWLKDHDRLGIEWTKSLVWANPLVLSARAGRLFPLLPVVRRKHVVIVGPPHLHNRVVIRRQYPIRSLADVVPSIRRFIDVPAVDCWTEHDRVRADVLRAYEEIPDRPLLFGFSAAYLSNVLIHELHDIIGDDCWLIDFGSIWEPYVGVGIRNYHGPLLREFSLLT